MDNLAAINTKPLDGNTPFIDGLNSLDFNLYHFWQWGFSNITDNTIRGIIAEYLVAQAVGSTQKVRETWASYDLIDANGITIEVKSAAYLQSWVQKSYSPISFKCRETYGWDSSTNIYDTNKARQAQVYVFAVLTHKCKDTLNPLDVSQWQFYVISTNKLNLVLRNQQSISLTTLKKMVDKPISYPELNEAITQAAKYSINETST